MDTGAHKDSLMITGACRSSSMVTGAHKDSLMIILVLVEVVRWLPVLVRIV